MAEPSVPLYLDRRSAALLADYLLALLLVGLLSAPFVDTVGLRIPHPFFARTSVVCADMETLPEWLPENALRVGRASMPQPQLCQDSVFGIPNGRYAAFYLETRRDEHVTVWRRVFVPVDSNLEPVELPDLSRILVLLVLIVVSGTLTLFGKPSPGKALVGLRLDGPKRRAYLREFLRFLPFIVLLGLPLYSPVPLFLGPMLAIQIWPMASLGTLAAIGVGIAWYYAWPIIHWTGQTRYDRFAGYTVTR